MKVALVHDYLREFGGAERVLRVLADMYPEAPIYTAFAVRGSEAEKAFRDRKVVESKLAWLLKIWKLYSPLRFLAPYIWKNMDLSGYDLVIASSSWYITRGFKVGPDTKVICYCHTPPRYLYGYETSIDLQKYFLVRVYAVIVNHFLRLFDFESAQKVDQFVVNSRNVQQRVEKFYRKSSVIVYPPIETKKFTEAAEGEKKDDYFLIVSRLVGAKGLEQAARAAKKLKFKLKIAGGEAGYSDVATKLKRLGGEMVELLGRVSEETLVRLYARAKGFIALAREEDFGMTVVEAMAAGTAVIAFNGGGFRETVKEGEGGILIDDTSEEAIEEGIRRFNKIKWNRRKIMEWAKRFDRKEFERGIKKVVNDLVR